MYDKVTFFLCFSIIYTLNKDIIICSSEKSINKDHMHNKYINILVYVLLQKKYKQGSYAYVSIWIYKLYKYIGHIFMYVYSCVCVGICAYMYQSFLTLTLLATFPYLMFQTEVLHCRDSLLLCSFVYCSRTPHSDTRWVVHTCLVNWPNDIQNINCWIKYISLHFSKLQWRA